MTAAEAITAIVAEANRARRLHPHWPADPIHAAAIVAEESGELVRAALAELDQCLAILHEQERAPGYEYAITKGPRKAHDCLPPEENAGWIPNKHRGREGWQRFDFHEESYWMRTKPC